MATGRAAQTGTALFLRQTGRVRADVNEGFVRDGARISAHPRVRTRRHQAPRCRGTCRLDRKARPDPMNNYVNKAAFADAVVSKGL